MKSKLSRILILSFMFTVLNVAFTNCGGDHELLDTKSNKTDLSSEYNGGGYSGKVTYLYFADQPLCAADPLKPEAKIEFFNGEYLQSQNMCSSGESSQSVAPAMNPYNPYYLISGNKVFFKDDSVTALPAYNRVITYALCSNLAEQTDVVVRLEKSLDPSMPGGWSRTWKTQLISGVRPFYEEETKMIEPDSNGTVLVGISRPNAEAPYAKNIQVKIFNYGSAFVVRGEITIIGSPTVTMPADCYILN